MRVSLLLAAALFLALPAGAQQSNAPVSAEQQVALRASILAATQTPDFKRSRQVLEVYRTLRAAGVTLTSAEAFEMGEVARTRGLPGEAANAFALLGSDDPEYRRNERLIADMNERAAQDRATGLEESFQAVQLGANPWLWANVGEAFAGAGLHERAIFLYEHALALKASDPMEVDFEDPTKWSDADIARKASEAAQLYGRDASFYSVELQQRRSGLIGVAEKENAQLEKAQIQLNYGISLFRLGRAVEARATWSAITGSPSIEILAKAWIDIANRSAN